MFFLGKFRTHSCELNIENDNADFEKFVSWSVMILLLFVRS